MRTCSDHTLTRLKRHGAEVVHASPGACMDHGELATDLIACERMVWGERGCILDDVEVRQRGLHHDDVCAFRYVALLVNI